MVQADLALILQHEWQRRHSRNSRYSLRAFARSIDYDPSSLSKILRGRRRVGGIFIDRIGKKLGLSPEVIATLKKVHRRKGSSLLDASPLSEYETLSIDLLLLISDWYHYAILELIQTKDFRPDLEWVSTKLSISLTETTAAVERLKRLELLYIAPDGTWSEIRNSKLTSLSSQLFTHDALRIAQEQLMTKGIDAMTHVPIEKRDQSSLTFAFRDEDLPEIREEIKQFRRKLDSYASQKTDKNSVYAMTISLFPLTTEGENNE